MLDVTCVPQHIAFLQDINLLNKARENLESIIDTICYGYNEPKPRTCRRNASRDYLAFAKRKKQRKRSSAKQSESSSNTSGVILGILTRI